MVRESENPTFYLGSLTLILPSLTLFPPIWQLHRSEVSYAITVRSSEYGSDPAALAEMVRRSLAGGGGDVGRPDEDD